MNDIPSNVLLPLSLFERGEGDVEKTLELAEKYIRNGYKGYRIIEVKYPFAICHRGGFL